MSENALQGYNERVGVESVSIMEKLTSEAELSEFISENEEAISAEKGVMVSGLSTVKKVRMMVQRDRFHETQ